MPRPTSFCIFQMFDRSSKQVLEVHSVHCIHRLVIGHHFELDYITDSAHGEERHFYNEQKSARFSETIVQKCLTNSKDVRRQCTK